MPVDFFLTISELVEKAGFHFEEHDVQTKDGYILGMMRVMNDDVKAGAKRPAVFMQHGILSSADTFTSHYPSVAPAFRMARAGYDVYLGNNRGNQYSNRHIKLDPVRDSRKFHNYSFTEYGKYDLPAQIDAALKLSGQEKVTYVGHSQGTTQMFYALTQDEPKIMSKVNLFVALAPIVRPSHSFFTGIQTIVKHLEEIAITTNLLGIYSVMGPIMK